MDNYGAQYATTGAVPNGGTMWVNPNTSEPPAARIQILDEATQAIEGSTKFAYTLADEVRQIADSVFGAQPTAVAGGKETRPQSGRAMGLKNGTEALHAALSVLYSEIQRLRAL